jgi:hypothetical protein
MLLRATNLPPLTAIEALEEEEDITVNPWD